MCGVGRKSCTFLGRPTDEGRTLRPAGAHRPPECPRNPSGPAPGGTHHFRKGNQDARSLLDLTLTGPHPAVRPTRWSSIWAEPLHAVQQRIRHVRTATPVRWRRRRRVLADGAPCTQPGEQRSDARTSPPRPLPPDREGPRRSTPTGIGNREHPGAAHLPGPVQAGRSSTASACPSTWPRPETLATTDGRPARSTAAVVPAPP